MFFTGWTVEISGLPPGIFHVISAIIVSSFLERFSKDFYLKQFLDRCKKFFAPTCWHSTEPISKNELVLCYQPYRAFSHDVTAAILVFQNNETAAMLVFQTNSVGVELFSYVNASFFPINLHRAGHVSENATFLRFLL